MEEEHKLKKPSEYHSAWSTLCAADGVIMYFYLFQLRAFVTLVAAQGDSGCVAGKGRLRLRSGAGRTICHSSVTFPSVRRNHLIIALWIGVCLGLQVAVVEFARNVLGIPNANSAEVRCC